MNPIRWIAALLLVISIASSTSAQPAERQRLLLLVQGPDGHPAGTHEYVAGSKVLIDELQDVANLELITLSADEPWTEGPEQLRMAHGAVLYLAEGARWISADPRRLQAFQQLAERGGGLSCLHWAMGTRDPEYIDAFLRLFGGCHGGPDRKFQVLETTLAPAADNVAAKLPSFQIHDEFYYRLKFTKDANLLPLWYATIDGTTETVAWTWQRPDEGRSFGFSGGHFHENWERPEYRQLVRQGILWSMKIDEDPAPE